LEYSSSWLKQGHYQRHGVDWLFVSCGVVTGFQNNLVEKADVLQKLQRPLNLKAVRNSSLVFRFEIEQ